jgi:hypothetical protein
MRTSDVTPSARPNRFNMAIRSLDEDVTMHELALLLMQACEEVIELGEEPAVDVACAVISARIGFASPADTMSAEAWKALVQLVIHETTATLELRDNAAQ